MNISSSEIEIRNTPTLNIPRKFVDSNGDAFLLCNGDYLKISTTPVYNGHFLIVAWVAVIYKSDCTLHLCFYLQWSLPKRTHQEAETPYDGYFVARIGFSSK